MYELLCPPVGADCLYQEHMAHALLLIYRSIISYACCLYCDMLKLYYVLPPGCISGSISSRYNTISKGIRNDDQSLSPVTPLVSLLFKSVIPNPLKCSGTFLTYWFLGFFNTLGCIIVL